MASLKDFFKPGIRLFTYFFKPMCLFCLAVSLSIILSQQAYPASLTLAWDPADDLSDGFSLYFGLESGNYTEVIDVGPSTQYTISGLEPGQTYYFAITAYNSFDESDFSEELMATAPVFCEGDFDMDGDVDGADLMYAVSYYPGLDPATVTAEFGRTDCP